MVFKKRVVSFIFKKQEVLHSVGWNEKCWKLLSVLEKNYSILGRFHICMLVLLTMLR